MESKTSKLEIKVGSDTFVIGFPALHEAQQEVANSDARWKILCAGRRFGKSRLGVQLCMQAALQGKRAWWVAPTFAIARVGWRAIEAAAMSFPQEIRPKVSLANMEVTFENGADNQESLFSDLNERLRNIEISPAGFIYLLTDGPGGKLIKVLPKE